MKSAKPSTHLNFFQNYSYHANYMNGKLDKSVIGLIKNKDMGDELLKHATIFEPLHDVYDYCDELVGATGVPAATMITSLHFLYKSCVYLYNMAAIKFFDKEGAMDKQSQYALSNLQAAGVALFLAAAIFAKSCISLVSRPIATMFQGWNKETKTERFWSNDVQLPNASNGQAVATIIGDIIDAEDPMAKISELSYSI